MQVLYHASYTEKATQIIEGLKTAYEPTSMGDLNYFLRVRVVRDRQKKSVTLLHDSYIEKIATKFGASKGRFPSTPLPTCEFVKNTGQATPAQVKEYQEKVGSILYTGIMLRPDVAFAASQLSNFLTNPSLQHLEAANWTLRYLYGTIYLGIVYSRAERENQLVVSTDASFADDPETRRSSQGYIFFLFGGAILWKAVRQNTVTTSSTEAELLALVATVKEMMALQRFFREIRLEEITEWNVYCDNQQTIRLVVGDNERISTKLRHVDISNMWIRQEYRNGRFKITYLPTDEMHADGLTKNLSRQKHESFIKLLNLQGSRSLIEKLALAS